MLQLRYSMIITASKRARKQNNVDAFFSVVATFALKCLSLSLSLSLGN